MPVYEYPPYDFESTEEMTNLELEAVEVGSDSFSS